jgi:hypothetical protein
MEQNEKIKGFILKPILSSYSKNFTHFGCELKEYEILEITFFTAFVEF